MAEFSIAMARRQDCDQILRLITELARYEKLEHEVVASADDLERSLFSKRPEAECLLAWMGERCVGMALFFHNYSTFLGRSGLYLEDLFVETEIRGQGVGKALLCALAKLACDRGCGRFEWSVLDWNQPSIEFYRALGAESMDEWTVFRLSGAPMHQLAEQAPKFTAPTRP